MSDVRDVFTYTLGKQGGDYTGPYYITLKGTPTLKECIEQVLRKTGEWGTIEVIVGKDRGSGEFSMGYNRGDVHDDGIPMELYDEKVISACGSGGWTYSRFSFILEECEGYEA